MQKLRLAPAIVGLICFSCNSPAPRLNAPPHGTAERVSPMQSTLVEMTDNALLADMTVSDIHFRPGRAALNTLGQERLSRLASLLQAHGGYIRFYTQSVDQDLVQQRLATIREFLSQAGIDTAAEVVRQDLPGARGMEASEAILIKKTEGGYRQQSSKTCESEPNPPPSGQKSTSP
jgi:hypothetical protein